MPFTQNVPVELQHVFVDTIVKQYLNAYPADNHGLVHVEMVRLEVEARKIDVNKKKKNM
ncbi:MAG: hypothetical protein ACTSUE_07120 [Promethearchaeota archaeon]